MNFLEQLAGEWFAYKGYFVRTNIKLNKRSMGGWDNELDVLAYSAKTGELIHAESTWDAASWPKRKERFLTKKFVYTHAEYEALVGVKIERVRKIALVGLGQSTKSDLDWGRSIEVVLIPHFIAEIAKELTSKNPLNDIVPEGFPRLRAMQFALWYGTGGEPVEQTEVAG
jgi:hypothetical protein